MVTLEALEVRVLALEKARDNNNEEHGKVFGRIEKVEKEHGVLQADLGHIQQLCNEIKSDVKEIKERPVKRYDHLANAVLQWLVLGVLAAAIVFKGV